MFILEISRVKPARTHIARPVRTCLSNEAAIPLCKIGSKTAAARPAAGKYTGSGNDSQKIHSKIYKSGSSDYHGRWVAGPVRNLGFSTIFTRCEISNGAGKEIAA